MSARVVPSFSSGSSLSTSRSASRSTSRSTSASAGRLAPVLGALVAGSLAALSGCVVQSQGGFGGTGTHGGGGGGGRGTLTMPNVFGLPKDRAVAELRRAGYAGGPTFESSLCGSVVEGRVISIGEVCNQQPAAGVVQGARLPISLRVQTEDPWHGNAGKPNEWRLMPRIVGLTLEQARAELARVGFRPDEGVMLDWVDEPGCKPRTVCSTYPAALERAGVHSGKIISVARDPRAVAPKPAGDPAVPPSPPTDKPAGAEPQPEPFF